MMLTKGFENGAKEVFWYQEMLLQMLMEQEGDDGHENLLLMKGCWWLRGLLLTKASKAQAMTDVVVSQDGCKWHN